MLKSPEAKDELAKVLPDIRHVVDALQSVAKLEVDARVELWPNLVEKQVEGEVHELIDTLAAATHDLIGVLDKWANS